MIGWEEGWVAEPLGAEVLHSQLLPHAESHELLGRPELPSDPMSPWRRKIADCGPVAGGCVVRTLHCTTHIVHTAVYTPLVLPRENVQLQGVSLH